MNHCTLRSVRRYVGALAALAALAACAPRAEVPAPEPGIPKNGAPPNPYRYVYRCEGDYRFTVKVGTDTATLSLGERVLVLPQQVAASGTRYEASGVTFWSKGLLAMLETPAKSYHDCVGQPAWTPEDATALLSPGGAKEGAPLEGTEWRLFELNRTPALTPQTGSAPMLRFDASERRISGNTGCNLLGGSYTRSGEQLRFGTDLLTTRMACLGAPFAEQEQSFLRMLPRVTRFVVWGQTLTLYAGTEPVARFTVGS